MIELRRSEDRGHADHGWLDARHTFSFADYYDPRHVGFRTLRVINEDVVRGGAGFGEHPHHDMEIVTYILSGALRHRDSAGHSSVIGPGRIQRMSAGRGIRHSEVNASPTEPVHLLQIWITPERPGIDPSYEEIDFPESELSDRLRLIASRDGREGSLRIHQDAEIRAARLGAGSRVVHAQDTKKYSWIQLAKGQVRVNGQAMKAGDGLALEGESSIEIEAVEPSELLLFTLA